MKIGDKISDGLKSIDQFMDRSGLSCINNLVNCVTKICRGVYCFFYGDLIRERHEKGEEAFLERYWSYIDSKDALTCGLGLVPVLGSVLIWAKGKFKPEDSASFIYSPVYQVESFEAFEQEGGEIVETQGYFYNDGEVR